MKRFIIVVLLLCLSLLTFAACDVLHGTQEEPLKTEQGVEGDSDNKNGENKSKRTPVQPISDGDKINFS